MKPAVVGIDVGGTKTLCVLVDGQCEAVERVKFKTEAAEGRKQFTGTLKDAARELQKEARRRKLEIVGVGIGFAGRVDREKGSVVNSPNLLALEGYPIAKHAQKAFGGKVLVENDVRMGIYGEYRLGAARGANTVLGVFFGTGVGSAAIINGILHEGASEVGGQVGAVLAQPVGGPEAAMSHGIVDRIASKSAIAGEALVMAIKQWAPYLHEKVGSDLERVTWGIIKEAIKRGDKRLEEMLRARMRVVGIALSSVVNFLNPEKIVLGGGLMDTMPKLVRKEVEAGLREYLTEDVDKALKVEAAALGGDAVALGAAQLALERFVGGMMG